MGFLSESYEWKFRGVSGYGSYSYEFISVGRYTINKVVTIKPFTNMGHFTLSFGNLEQSGRNFAVNESATENNVDYVKVLNTVFICLYDFLERNKETLVVFYGNTVYKNKLYKRKINAYFDELDSIVFIEGSRIKERIKPIKKYREKILPNGKKIMREYYEKDISILKDKPEVELVEKYNTKNSECYDFVTFRCRI